MYVYCLYSVGNHKLLIRVHLYGIALISESLLYTEEMQYYLGFNRRPITIHRQRMLNNTLKIVQNMRHMVLWFLERHFLLIFCMFIDAKQSCNKIATCDFNSISLRDEYHII